jgi:HB1, ASXL, restriction endonuclease HTH domain
LDQTLKVLESLRDGTFMTGLAMPQGASLSLSPSTPTVTISAQEIPHGTFHGMSIEPAIKKLLQIRKRAMGAQEIANALREGGLHMQSQTPEKTIASILSRAFNSGSDIVRVSRGMWGLQEWHPTQRFSRRGAED